MYVRTCVTITFTNNDNNTYLRGTSSCNLFTSLVNHPACNDSLSASAVVFNLPPTILPTHILHSYCACKYT